MSFRIEPASLSYLSGIAEVEKTCFSKPWSETSLASEFSKNNSVMLVALGDDCEIIGWAGLEHICGEGSVTNIAVIPKARRCGVGQALAESLINFSRKRSLDWLMLEVRISNLAAISLYQKLGFETIGIRPKFYDFPREDAMLMRHSLTR